MLATCRSVAFLGAEARLVEVEVHVGTGLPHFAVVGLPTKSVTEATQRVRSALESTQPDYWPQRRIIANLAPGALRKEGTHFDLSIALGILAARGLVERTALRGWVWIGELALDGALRPVRGALAAAMTVRSAGLRGMICPAGNASEARLVSGVEVVPVSSLRQCIEWLGGEWRPPLAVEEPMTDHPPIDDFVDVRGHADAKRALEIAAAGGHNVLLVGPPGSGKTMLARRLAGILPPMSLEETLDVTRIYSVAGLLEERARLVRERPFRSPHHHVSAAGLIGGGAVLARPGEVSLAHRGVLFLDEVALYRPEVLDSLRAPLEEGVVRIARSGGVVTYPCRFSLVAAMNPCPCGRGEEERLPCRCTPRQLELYGARLSGPMLDRLDIQVKMDRLGREELLGAPSGEPSAVIRGRVTRARECQLHRYGTSLAANGSVPKPILEAHLGLSPSTKHFVGEAIDTFSLSGRGVDRILRVARTIADLEGGGAVSDDHVGQALHLRLAEAPVGAQP